MYLLSNFLKDVSLNFFLRGMPHSPDDGSKQKLVMKFVLLVVRLGTAPSCVKLQNQPDQIILPVVVLKSRVLKGMCKSWLSANSRGCECLVNLAI